MIKVNGFVIKPTIFPDGTSQVWKLPEGLLENKYVTITWYFEAERELIDVFGIRALFPSAKEICLFMPYLPYARQDSEDDGEWDCGSCGATMFVSRYVSVSYSTQKLKMAGESGG